MKKENLYEAIGTDYVKEAWNEKTYIRMILKGKEVFRLVQNAVLEVDHLNLIDENNEMTCYSEKYEVIGYDEDESSLYIYISEIADLEAVFKKIVDKLINMKWSFEIFNLSSLTEESNYLKNSNIEKRKGEDLLAIYTYEGINEFIILEDDEFRLKKLLRILETY